MRLLSFFSSTIGKKFLVAVTGLYMVVFLIGHIAGNLQIFLGPDAINSYGVLLRSYPITLWTLRITLIIAVIIHIYLTIDLTRKNREARPHKYVQKKSRKASITSRTMMISGLTVLAFLLYHLAHFTFGITDPAIVRFIDDQGRHHIYNMMVVGFLNPLVSLFYIIALILLCMHVSHGFSSAARTLGVSTPSRFLFLRNFGRGFAVIILLLYASIPLAILFRFITPDI